MAAASGLFLVTFRDALDATALAVNVEGDTFKMAFATNTYTPDFNAHDSFADLTNEVTGTNLPSGGLTMAGETLTVASGNLTMDATDTAQASVTASSIRQRMVYDDTLAGDPPLVNTDFTSDFNVTAGTFTVQESASGIWVIDGTP